MQITSLQECASEHREGYQPLHAEDLGIFAYYELTHCEWGHEIRYLRDNSASALSRSSPSSFFFPSSFFAESFTGGEFSVETPCVCVAFFFFFLVYKVHSMYHEMIAMLPDKETHALRDFEGFAAVSSVSSADASRSSSGVKS